MFEQGKGCELEDKQQTQSDQYAHSGEKNDVPEGKQGVFATFIGPPSGASTFFSGNNGKVAPSAERNRNTDADVDRMVGIPSRGGTPILPSA